MDDVTQSGKTTGGGTPSRPVTSGSTAAPSPAATGPSTGATAAADDVALHFARLTEAVDAKMRVLADKERSVAAAEARLSAASERMAAVSGRRGAADVIRLNVGGATLATSRRTLTLVPDSLLATMFSGDWDDHLARDPSGAFFLDYDPHLFSGLVNWLRACDLAGPEAPLGEVRVEQERQEQLLVLVDFLQLHRHIPCRFTEVFSPTLSSPYVVLSDSISSTSTSTSGVASGTGYHTVARRTAGGGGSGAYAVAAAAHCHFDTHVEVVLHVERFGALRPAANGGGSGTPEAAAGPAAPGQRAGGNAGRAGAGGPQSSQQGGAGGANAGGSGDEGAVAGGTNHPMFVGVMCRGQLASLDQRKRNANATWQSTCHGWWTHCRQGCKVQGGQARLLEHKPLWVEGDTLVLSLDAVRRSDTPLTAAAPAAAPGAAGAGTAAAAAAEEGDGAAAASAGPAAGAGAGTGGAVSGGSRGSVQLSLTNCRTSETLKLHFSPEALGGGNQEQWVVVVGLSGVGDSVRIASARRVGMRPPRPQDV